MDVADVVYLLILATFFGLAAGYVKACDAIVGPDQAAPAEAHETPEPESLAA